MIVAIVLAAGQSRRMGTQKLLLPFGGRTVIGHVVGQVTASPVDRTIIVARPDSGDIAQALAGLPVTIVTNPDPDGDMLSSVRCGLAALPEQCDSVVVVLGDQPSITSDLIAQMLQAYAAGGCGIMVPVHSGKSGHPLVFSAGYRQEILIGFDDTGLRGLLDAHRTEVLEFPVSSPSVLEDMDYPQDYQRELARLRGVKSPGVSP